MVCRLSLIRCDLLIDRSMVGRCMFARAAEREVAGLSLSMADIACPTAMFCGAVWFISWIR